MVDRTPEHTSFRKSLADDIKRVRNLGNVDQKTKSDLINDLIRKKPSESYRVVCPYPNHSWYKLAWENAWVDWRIWLKENIRVTDDNKIEIIKAKKKISLLVSNPNNKDIFDGSYVDEKWNTGRPWLLYFTPEAALRETEKQGKKIFRTEAELKTFLEQTWWLFDGEDSEYYFGSETSEKIKWKLPDIRQPVNSLLDIDLESKNKVKKTSWYLPLWSNEWAYSSQLGVEHCFSSFLLAVEDKEWIRSDWKKPYYYEEGDGTYFASGTVQIATPVIVYEDC